MEQPRTILVTAPFDDRHLETIKQNTPREWRVRHVACSSQDDVAAALDPSVEILYARRLPEDLSGAPALKWIQLHSAGVDRLLEHPVLDSEIQVTTTSGIHGVPIAEYTIGAILLLLRQFPRLVRQQDQRQWTSESGEPYLAREFRGSTLCVVGYGSIGREVARLADAMGARVLAVKNDPADRADHGYFVPGTGDPDGSIPHQYYASEALSEALSESDIVVVATPLTDATRGLIGEDELRAMKESAFLVNIGRGAVIDEEALIRALKEGWIGGAALDVFTEEPLPEDSPLWELDNVFISPHVSGATPMYDFRASDLFAENLRRYFDGQPLWNRVERSKGY